MPYAYITALLATWCCFRGLSCPGIAQRLAQVEL